MKIEKISDKQIRCTLTHEDLAERQLKLSELAYGTEKAKSLFREMMQQAALEFGFEAEDTPLMIEAIPISRGSIILNITKVEYPEELDTRFSQFSQSTEHGEAFVGEHSKNAESDTSFEEIGADDVLDFFRKLQDEYKNLDDTSKKNSKFVPLEKNLQNKTSNNIPKPQIVLDMSKLFVFKQFDDITRLAHILKGFYHGSNVLYKNAANKKYYLVINMTKHTPEEFNKVCNILSEYAGQEKYSASIQAYFEEHYDVILRGNALQVLADL